MLTLWLSAGIAFSQQVQVLDLRDRWRFTIGDREEYASISYDDKNWEYIEVPAAWESQGFSNYNGFAWYRYSFDGDELTYTDNLILNLGYIDDVHEVYLNNELLGFKGSFPPDYYTAYNAFNEYTIPPKLINPEGKNVIAVKVYDLTQDGGIVKGRDIGIWSTPHREAFQTLEGIWKFTTDSPFDWQDPELDDSEWDQILVPSFWRSKHIKRRSKSYAYYRKDFYLNEETTDRDLYLVLGKIDDFDRTYVNGKLVGATKDDLDLGDSRSYREERVYRIPMEILNQNGRNVIAVEVEDIGGDAGIYEGPIGIMMDRR